MLHEEFVHSLAWRYMLACSQLKHTVKVMHAIQELLAMGLIGPIAL